jgi:ribosomal-protein-alanine N-acetyltransferase
MKQYKSFETARLLLKPTSEEDAALIYALLNTPKWIKFIGDRNVKSLEDAKEYIRNRMLTQLERLGYSNYTVIHKADSVKVGVCGLYDREGLEGIDIGFALLPEHEGRGYAFEAACEIKRAANEAFGLSLLRAITIKENVASQNLLRKLDFSYVKNIRLADDGEELLLFEYKNEKG